MFLRVGAPYYDYPPNRMYKNGEIGGMCIDILHELAKRSNFRKQYFFLFCQARAQAPYPNLFHSKSIKPEKKPKNSCPIGVA